MVSFSLNARGGRPWHKGSKRASEAPQEKKKRMHFIFFSSRCRHAFCFLFFLLLLLSPLPNPIPPPPPHFLTNVLSRGYWSVHVHLRDRQRDDAGRVKVVGEQGVAPRERVGHRRRCSSCCRCCSSSCSCIRIRAPSARRPRVVGGRRPPRGGGASSALPRGHDCGDLKGKGRRRRG